jgi:Fur family peroxide stress response transcriptional regulator
MRYSHQREVIEKIVRSTKTHPNAEWVYNEAKKKIENISLGTVYRNLKILERTGSIKSIHDSSQVRYDGNVDDHHHLKCIECGVLIDTDIKSDYDREKIIENYDFEPDDIKFFIIGKCKKHKKNKQGVINGFSR